MTHIETPININKLTEISLIQNTNFVSHPLTGYSKRPPYYTIFLALLLLKRKRYKLPESRFNDTMKQIKCYIEAIL